MAGDNKFHALSCFLNAPERTSRHDMVVGKVVTVLRQRYPVSTGAIINLEAEVGTKEDGSSVTADIVVTVGVGAYLRCLRSEEHTSELQSR